MRRLTWPAAILALGCSTIAPAWALSDQTWVSGVGNDVAPCSIAAPCRTFAFAFAQTNTRGIINVASSGDFGPVSLNRSISIVGDSAEAGVFSHAGGAAIKVLGNNTEVLLRGLTIDLFGANKTGIIFSSGVALHVHNSVIRGTADGIKFSPNAGASALFVSDSLILNTAADGIVVFPSNGASVKASINRTRVQHAGGNGLAFIGLFGGINATIGESVSAGNVQTGIWASGNSGSPLNVMIDRSSSLNNGSVGVHSDSAQIRIGDSTVTGNNTGLLATSGGTIDSYGSTKVHGNFPGGNGAVTGSIAYQ
jgi:hypothetical protein